jgi:ABC-2 type transport system permease protein
MIFVILVGVTMSCLSYAFALRTKSEETLGSVFNSVLLPVLLLSGILLPLSLAPNWLYVVSRFNPLSYIVDGARSVFVGTLDWHVYVGAGVAVLLAAGSAAFAYDAFNGQGNT